MNIVEATFIQVKADFHMFVTIAAMAGKKKSAIIVITVEHLHNGHLGERNKMAFVGSRLEVGVSYYTCFLCHAYCIPGSLIVPDVTTGLLMERTIAKFDFVGL